MIPISDMIALNENELEINAVRAQGTGGQNVNKVSSAVHLRFDIQASSLPDFLKKRLLNRSDSRITKNGIIIIKAQQYRTQEMNRQDAVERLINLIREAGMTKKRRKPTTPTAAGKERRINEKRRRSQIKAARNFSVDKLG